MSDEMKAARILYALKLKTDSMLKCSNDIHFFSLGEEALNQIKRFDDYYKQTAQLSWQEQLWPGVVPQLMDHEVFIEKFKQLDVADAKLLVENAVKQIFNQFFMSRMHLFDQIRDGHKRCKNASIEDVQRFLQMTHKPILGSSEIKDHIPHVSALSVGKSLNVLGWEKKRVWGSGDNQYLWFESDSKYAELTPVELRKAWKQFKHKVSFI